MRKSTAEVVAHSRGPERDELITILGTFPRIVLAEVNTHRILSKNTSSSRAIPFFKAVKMVSNNPFIPYAFQGHHSGMQGTTYLDPNKKVKWEEVQPIIHEMISKNFSLEDGDWSEIEFSMNEYVWPLFRSDESGRTPAEWWLQVRNIVIGCAVMIYAMGVTKQIANRLLEPFMWVTDILTGTKDAWESFFYLRAPKYTTSGQNGTHTFRSREEILSHTGLEGYVMSEEILLSFNKGQAEIHMMDFAEKCWDAIRKSEPKELKGGEWHIPFEDKILQMVTGGKKNVKTKVNLSLFDVLKISTAMCARVSYTVVGAETAITTEALIEVYDMKLIDQDPPHSSPFEHCARVMITEDDDEEGIDNEYYHFVKGNDLGHSPEFGWCNNFKGFIQLRYLIEKENFKL